MGWWMSWVRTSSNTATRALGLRTPGGTVVGQQSFGVVGSYTRVSLTVDSGAATNLVFFARLTATGDTWIQIDDVSVVGPVATSTSLTASESPSAHGQPVTFTATVAPAPAAGETITFHDGADQLGTATTDAAGVATLTTSALAVGPHSITATYAGSETLLASTSPPLAHTVDQAATITAPVSSSANPSVHGDPVTFSTTVAPQAPGAGVPTGTVEFFDGTTSLGTAPLVDGQASLTTTALARGTHEITAVYSGDGSFVASDSSAAPLTQTVDKRRGPKPR